MAKFNNVVQQKRLQFLDKEYDDIMKAIVSEKSVRLIIYEINVWGEESMKEEEEQQVRYRGGMGTFSRTSWLYLENQFIFRNNLSCSILTNENNLKQQAKVWVFFRSNAQWGLILIEKKNKVN